MNNNEIMIRAENLWKRYGIPPGESLRKKVGRHVRAIYKGGGSLEHPLGWHKDDGGIWSLKNVSFEVRRGETFGVIGRNGSGKSTLLKLLALTSPQTFGDLEVKGRIFSMIELGAGMNIELTGRENVRLLGTIMGFSPRWISLKIPEIEAFCELGEWFDRPVWQYSSGMTARLGFAVAVNADADVLLVDEVLAVGDLPFQKKCHDKLEELRIRKMTTVFVSHNIRQVERLCQRAMFLNKGQVVTIGESTDVANTYYEFCNRQEKAGLKDDLPVQSYFVNDQITIQGDLARFDTEGTVFVTKYEFLDEEDKPIRQVENGKVF